MAKKTSDAEPTDTPVPTPKGLVFTVATHDGRQRFALGEPIQIDLQFSSTLADAYEVDMGTYDRSGRLWSESFVFEKPGIVVDPLADYFGVLRGGMGGIRRMPPTLTREPTVITVTLNEWVRFAGPGIYRFRALSTRPSPKGKRGESLREPGVASGNTLALEIVDDPAWAARELARVRAVLDAGGDEEKMTAARFALRMLTTPEAARAMVDDLCRPPRKGDEYRWNTQAGLYGSPDRQAVRAMLKEAITRPDCAVSEPHLDLLARLDTAGPPEQDRQGAFAAARDKLVSALTGALGQKTGEALPVSALTALSAVGTHGAGTRSDEAAALRARVVGILGKLPDEPLQRLLTQQWALVKTPALVPALTALVNEARPRGGQLRSISDLALERLVELDYNAAKAFILAELARPARTSFSAATLGRLKDAELPDLDATLAAGLKDPDTSGEGLELRAGLFARYATSARQKEAWDAYKAVSYFRISLLGYLARHDPKAANAEIARIADIDSLRRLSLSFWSPAVEAAVASKLQGVNTSQAAGLLAERGSAAAEPLLWTKLTSMRDERDKGLLDQVQRAITRGQGWMTPPDRLKALAEVCCRDDINHLLSRWGDQGKQPQLVLWSQRASGELTGWLAHYDVRSLDDVKHRIAQLPAGMTLVWTTQPSDVDDEVMAEVRKAAEAKQIAIVRGK